VSTYSYFVQNFALPLLVGVAVFIIGTVKHWSIKKRIVYVVLIVLLAWIVSFIAVQHRTSRTRLAIAGTVVDEISGDAIAQAMISLADGSQHDLSEDNGNFRLDLTDKATAGQRVRIHVTKDGYSSFDGSVEIPAEGFLVRLRHL
jgi:hypothetical protein